MKPAALAFILLLTHSIGLADTLTGRVVRVTDGDTIVGKVLLSEVDMYLNQVETGLAWHNKKYQNEQSPTDRGMYSDADRGQGARAGIVGGP